MRSPAVLFDLDGCLADSRAPITGAMNAALAQLGAQQRTEDELAIYIGPPTQVAFGELLDQPPGSAAVADAVARYRELYRDTLTQTTAFPGIPEVLDGLRADGTRLALATSKPRKYALLVLDSIGLRDRFDVIGAPDLDESETKAQTIAKAIAELDADPFAHVGDRLHDIEGAREHGLLAVGVLWGMGSRSELEQAGADVLVERPQELFELLRSRARR